MSAKVNRQMDLTPWTGVACEFSDGVPGTTLLQVSRMMFSKNVLVVDIKYFFFWIYFIASRQHGPSLLVSVYRRVGFTHPGFGYSY